MADLVTAGSHREVMQTQLVSYLSEGNLSHGLHLHCGYHKVRTVARSGRKGCETTKELYMARFSLGALQAALVGAAMASQPPHLAKNKQQRDPERSSESRADAPHVPKVDDEVASHVR